MKALGLYTEVWLQEARERERADWLELIRHGKPSVLVARNRAGHFDPLLPTVPPARHFSGFIFSILKAYFYQIPFRGIFSPLLLRDRIGQTKEEE